LEPSIVLQNSKIEITITHGLAGFLVRKYFNDSVAYRAAIGPNSLTQAIKIRGQGTITMAFNPPLETPIFLYIQRWNPGKYYFSESFIFKSCNPHVGASQIENGQYRYLVSELPNSTNNCSGILQFPAGINKLKLVSIPNNSRNGIFFTFAGWSGL